MKITITHAPTEAREALLIASFAKGLGIGAEANCETDRENDPHCRACRCASCDIVDTEECLEGADLCEKCDHASHTGYCPWHQDEQ